MKSRPSNQAHFCNLQLGGKPLLSDFDGANVLADEFSKVFLSDDGRLPVQF